ncbi:MAG: 5' nucleotidase, NT5C type [Bacilli bacterium]|jgi:uncharacterized HAD superfamily protein
MKIGIDIDDTMTKTSELIIKYAKEYFKSDELNEINQRLYSLKYNKELRIFLSNYLPIMMKEYQLKDDVKEVINRLRERGHKIFIITTRAHTIKKGLKQITKEYFKKHQIKVDKIIFGTVEKGETCFNHQIDIMIDDNIKMLDQVKEKGIKTLLFTSINNINSKTNHRRVNSWLELEEYLNNLEEKI